MRYFARLNQNTIHLNPAYLQILMVIGPMGIVLSKAETNNVSIFEPGITQNKILC